MQNSKSSSVPATKPKLRGFIHQEAFFVSLGACLMLIAKSTHTSSAIASVVYSFGLLFLLGVSATYHRVNWTVKTRTWLKRLDHSAIFVLIAGSFTPICMLVLHPDKGMGLLLGIWICAVIGITQSIFWVKAPKWLTSLLYVGMGWAIVPYIKMLNDSLGVQSILLLFLGGVAYTIGAIIYVLKKPKLFANTFGYHELFHLLTIIAASLHFIVIYKVIT